MFYTETEQPLSHIYELKTLKIEGTPDPITDIIGLFVFVYSNLNILFCKFNIIVEKHYVTVPAVPK